MMKAPGCGCGGTYGLLMDSQANKRAALNRMQVGYVTVRSAKPPEKKTQIQGMNPQVYR
jgi:hypothetical protein